MSYSVLYSSVDDRPSKRKKGELASSSIFRASAANSYECPCAYKKHPSTYIPKHVPLWGAKYPLWWWSLKYNSSSQKEKQKHRLLRTGLREIRGLQAQMMWCLRTEDPDKLACFYTSFSQSSHLGGRVQFKYSAFNILKLWLLSSRLDCVYGGAV